MDDQQEERKKSPDLNDFYNKAQNLRLARQLGKKLGKKLAANFGKYVLALTSEVWGLAILATLLLLAFLTPFVMLSAPGAALITPGPTTTDQNSSISTKFNSYFCQGAAKWQSSSCNLGNYGCSPTSMAMILNSFGTAISPPEVSLRYFDGAGCNRPTDVASYVSKFGSLGFTIGPNLVSLNKLNMLQVENFINAGYLIIAASGPFKCYPTNSCTSPFIAGHEFVIQGVNPSQNTITIRDPNSCAYGASEDVEKPEHNIREVTSDNFGSFFHAYPIKKT